MLVNKVGADPEFEIVANGRLVRADRVVRTTRLPFGEIGFDGAGVALELRPNPGSVDELVRNTAKLIVAAPSLCRGTPTTIGVGHPIGGHVHFDVPYDSTDDEALGARERLVRVIDDALGPMLRALNGPAREKSKYGKRRDWRPQSWGVEYRTPPATIWAHPEVARGFLNAMITLAISDGREMTPTYDELVELAAFAIESGRRLHYGAWKEVAESAPRAFSVVYEASAEKDEHFEGDMRDALAPLGISLLRVYPLHKKRGDWASNLPGFGSMVGGFSPAYFEAGELYVALSWRFRNEMDFRRKALPAFLEAVLGLIRDANEPELDEMVVVVEAVEKPTASESTKEEVKKAAEEDRSAPAPTPPIATEDDWYVLCDGCEREVHVDDVIYDRRNGRFCPECYYEIYALCERCGREVDRDNAYFPSAGRYWALPLCEDCYEELYSRCGRCENEIEVEHAFVPTSGRYSGSHMCQRCYWEWYTRCECGERHIAHEENDRTLCERCVEEEEEEVEA